MKVNRIHIFVLLAAVFLCPLQSRCDDKPRTVVYEVKMKSAQGDMGARALHMKGSDFTWDYETGNLKMHFIKNKDGAFIIQPFGRFIGKYPAGSDRESPMTFLPGPIGDVKAFLESNKAEKVKEEKLNDKDCDVYTYHEKVSGWNCELWVEQKTMIPVQLILKGIKPEQNVTVTYVSYKTGVDVPDSLFVLPKDLKIRPMPDHLKTGAKPEDKKTGDEKATDSGTAAQPEKPATDASEVKTSDGSVSDKSTQPDDTEDKDK